MSKLNTVNPKIKFEIKALEDFIPQSGASVSLVTDIYYLLKAQARRLHYRSKGNFEQIFDAKKLIADGIANPDQFIKEKIVDMIKKNADDFWNDPTINSLFKGDGINSISELDIKSFFMQRFTAK